MGIPTPSRVREWLEAIYNYLTTNNTNTAAIVDEIRFLQRAMVGVDSVGTSQVDSFRERVSNALYVSVPDEFGTPVLLPLSVMFHQELVTPTELKTKSWLQEIRTVLRRIETHYLPDSDEAAAAGKLKEIRDAVAGLRASSGFPSETDAALGDIWQRLGNVDNSVFTVNTSITNSIVPALDILKDLVECLQLALAPDCEPPFVGTFPPIPADCDDGYDKLIAVVTPQTSGVLLDVSDWSVQLESGATDWLVGTGENSTQLLSVAPAFAAPKDVKVLLQFANGYTPDVTGGGFTLRALRRTQFPGAAGRPDKDINAFNTCETALDLYPTSSQDNSIFIGYGFTVSVNPDTSPMSQAKVRILVYEQTPS